MNAMHSSPRTLFSVLPVLALTLALVGCSTAKIESKKESGYSKTISRLLVVSHLASVNRETGKQAEQELTRRLSALNMDFRYLTVDPLSTSEDIAQYKTIQASYAPEGVLILRKTGGVVNQYGKIKQLDIGASLEDPAEKKVVWRASIVTSSLVPGVLNMPAFADKVIKEMQQANLIPSTPKT